MNGTSQTEKMATVDKGTAVMLELGPTLYRGVNDLGHGPLSPIALLYCGFKHGHSSFFPIAIQSVPQATPAHNTY